MTYTPAPMPGGYTSEKKEEQPAQLNENLIETINLVTEKVVENNVVVELADTYIKPTFIDQQTWDMMKDFIGGK